MENVPIEKPVSCRGVAAVIVTFHPGPEFLGNLCALRPQVDHLIVVDNGSSPQELVSIKPAVGSLRIQLIENVVNLGIAAALNLGLDRAFKLEAEWILLFDQDSRVPPGFARDMLRAFQHSQWRSRLAILTPLYRDPLDNPISVARVHDGIEIAMTSGSLFRAETFRQYGFFREELFIDGVDHEYSLRLRKAGLLLDQTPAATLLHALGAPTAHRLRRQAPVYVSNYPPIRRYYQERNKIWIARHYGSSFPAFCSKQLILSLKDLSKIVLIEKDSWPKVRFFMRGIADGLRGRMGKLNESPLKKEREKHPECR